jgi:hypothetical protein
LPLNSPFADEDLVQKLSLVELLENYLEKQQITLIKLPKYLFLLFLKFQNNGFFVERNKQSVDYDQVFELKGRQYKLICSTTIEGDGLEKIYESNVLHNDRWFEIQDLNVKPSVEQSILQKAPYILLYKMID